MIIFRDDKKFAEFKYNREDDFEEEIKNNSKQFFGESSIYIDAKKKINSKALGATIPDGFLFDLSDKDNPEFYLVEVELAKHDFFNHIFPQITKFFAFFRNNQSQTELVEKIYSIVNTNPELTDEFKKYLGNKEIYKFIKDVIENSQNILLILDNNKQELPDIIETYSDTWGKIVKLIILKKYSNSKDNIYTMDPEFENLEYIYPAELKNIENGNESPISEEFHLSSANDNVKNIYYRLKEELLKINHNLIFNPQKYYISIIHKKNIAYFTVRKSKLRLVVMSPEEKVRPKVRKNIFKSLSDGVQGFYGSPCCSVIIENIDNIDEIIDILRPLI